MKDVPIPQKSIDRINSTGLNGWFDVEIICSFMKTFDNVFVMTTSMTKSLYESSKISGRKDLSKFEFLSGPHWINQNHWTLFFVSFLNKQVVYFDPFGATVQMQEQFRKNWQAFCETKSWGKNIQWSSFITPTHKVQKDNYNCGPLVCKYFELFITNQYNKLQSDEFDMSKFRGQILKRLENNSSKTKVKHENKKRLNDAIKAASGQELSSSQQSSGSGLVILA